MEMKRPIPIPLGNECELRIRPRMVDGTAIVPTAFDEGSITVKVGGERTSLVPTIEDIYVCVTLPATQKEGLYDVELAGTIAGRPVQDIRQECYARCKCVPGVSKEVYETEWVVVGSSDAELEAIKEACAAARDAYLSAKAAADAEKAEYTRRLSEVDGIAMEVNATTNKLQILEAIDEIDIDIPEGIATEANVNAQAGMLADKIDHIVVPAPQGVAMEANATINKQEILTAIDHIEIDIPQGIATEANVDAQAAAIIAAMPSTSGLATEANATSNKADVIAAIPTVASIQSGLATSAGTDALSAKMDGLDGKIGEPSQGEASDLFGAIADVSDKLDGINDRQGKQMLVDAIVRKGSAADIDDPYSVLALKVNAIPQNVNTGQSQIEGYILPNEAMYNIYQVAQDIKGNETYSIYSGFMVAEYFRGYESITLTGANAYLTCDGDYYPQHNITDEVTHTWHDYEPLQDGTMPQNRWVVYFFSGTTSYTNSNANSCPRRAYIVGDWSSFVISGSSRLINIWIEGKLDHFEGGTNSDYWDKNIVVRNYKNHDYGNFVGHTGNTTYLTSASWVDLETLSGGVLLYNNAPDVVSLPKLKTITNGVIISGAQNNAGNIEELIMPELEEMNGNDQCLLNFYNNALGSKLTRIYAPKLRTITMCHLFELYNVSNMNNFHTIDLPSLEECNTSIGGGVGSSYGVVPVTTAKFARIGTAYNSGSSTTISRGNTYVWWDFRQASYALIGCTGTSNIVVVRGTQGTQFTDILTDIEIGDKEYIDAGLTPRWQPRQPITLYNCNQLTSENIALHMLDRLADNTDGATITITIGRTNLQRILADATYSSYVTAAQAKNYTIA